MSLSREEAEKAIRDALVSNGRQLRELGHAYVNLDANARHLIAKIALDAIGYDDSEVIT